MNRGPTVAQSLPVDRYAGNCLIKPSYYCGGGGVGLHNVALQEPPRCRYDVGTYHHHHSPPPPPTPYQHYQQLQDWYGRTAYWHHHPGGGGGGGGAGVGGPLAEKANFAAHKHGAPLIQAAKYNRIGGGPGKKYAKKTSGGVEKSNGGGGGKKNDGGSDESSGAASENSLPRIIKPRKRRKKERKPVPAAVAVVQPLVATIVPEQTERPSSSSSSSPPSPAPPPPPMPQQQQEQPFRQQLPSSPKPQLQRDDDRRPVDMIQLMSADIKAVSLEDVSTCQCACCDPVGNVWDVGRRCFSPSLTRPEPARRSWSDEPSSPPPPSSSISFSKTVVAAPAARIRTHSLEVSSEIVTSHNGHRDIEIKFFTMPIVGDH